MTRRIVICPHCQGAMEVSERAHDGKPVKTGDITLCAECLCISLLCEGDRLKPIEDEDIGTRDRAVVEQLRNRVQRHPNRGRIRA